MTAEDWRHNGIRVIRADQLDPNTAQTPGMERAAAIDFAHAEAGPGDFIFVPPYVPHQEINASTHEPLECVLVRSDSEAVVVPPAVALTRDHLARVPLVRTPPSEGAPR